MRDINRGPCRGEPCVRPKGGEYEIRPYRDRGYPIPSPSGLIFAHISWGGVALAPPGAADGSPRRATEPEIPARMGAGLRRRVIILKGPGGARPKGLPEPHVVANYTLMVAERAAVLVFQDDQLLLRTRDHLEQVGSGGRGCGGL